MISFYPGPSAVYPEVKEYLIKAYESGILSANHRSPEFQELAADTISLLREKLLIPDGYEVFFLSSATECWEVALQSLVSESSAHFFSGSFGEKWFRVAEKLIPKAKGVSFAPEALPEAEKAEEELICLTHNETSNGTWLPQKIISRFRELNPDKLIAVDATSSMAGIAADISMADVWFASVQKCFGLPAGLAVMIISPAGIEKAKQVNDRKHYNNILSQLENIKMYQTTHTPNVLDIFLLNNVMQQVPVVTDTERMIFSRAENWYDFFKNNKEFELHISNEEVRSPTVITINSEEEKLKYLKAEARKNGIMLGNGYGPLKNRSFRIANFPAIQDEHINKLQEFLTGIK